MKTALILWRALHCRHLTASACKYQRSIFYIDIALLSEEPDMLQASAETGMNNKPSNIRQASTQTFLRMRMMADCVALDRKNTVSVVCKNESNQCRGLPLDTL